jgi:hypothetical protein
MAVPTVEEFRTRYPEFEETSDDLIEIAISDAARSVDDSWLAGDYAPAIMSLAAHYLTAGSSAAEAVTDGGGPFIKAESIGRISTTYGDLPSSTDLTTTNYGNMYLEFFRRNRRHIVII